MITRTDFWKDFYSVLKTNVTSVSNRVYTSFPKQKNITFPLLELPDINRNHDIKTQANTFISSSNVLNVIIHAKTMAEISSIADSIETTVKSNTVKGRLPYAIEDLGFTEGQTQSGTPYHSKTIAVSYRL